MQVKKQTDGAGWKVTINPFCIAQKEIMSGQGWKLQPSCQPSSVHGGKCLRVWGELLCEQRVDWLGLLCYTGRTLLESQWVSILVKGQSKICNEFKYFHWMSVECVYACILLLIRVPPLPPCPTSQTLCWVASISAICTTLTACVPALPMLSLASLRCLASFLIWLFIPAYSCSISWPFLSCRGLG